MGSNQTITTSRDACTPLDEIEDISSTLEHRKQETFARWQQSTKDHDYDSLRQKLTGF